MSPKNTRVFTLQKGFQEKFFFSEADICIGAGAAGAGKTFALVSQVMANIWDPNYRGAIFRKRRTHIFSSGGLWEEAIKGARVCKEPIKTNIHEMRITYLKSGATLQFHHVYNNQRELEEKLQGSQFTTIFIDEADQIDYKAFRFMLSRLRSSSKVKSCVRLTTNPSSGWIKDFIRPFLDEDGRFPVKEKCEGLKWLYFDGDLPVIRDTKKEIEEEFNLETLDQKMSIKSFEFVPGTISDNQILIKNNPGYMGFLSQLPEFERNRFLYGSWDDRPSDGLFKEDDFKLYTALPQQIDMAFVVGDTALKTGKTNDYSVFSCWVTTGNELFLVDFERGKWSYQNLRERLLTFLQNHPYVDTCYLEDCGTGTVLLNDLNDEVKDVRFRAMNRVSKLSSKTKRAHEARAYLNKIEVFLPLDSVEKKKKFLSEVTSFSLDMSHDHDDITDTFFDAVAILGRAQKASRQEQKLQLSGSLVETIGGRSFVSN